MGCCTRRSLSLQKKKNLKWGVAPDVHFHYKKTYLKWGAAPEVRVVLVKIPTKKAKCTQWETVGYNEDQCPHPQQLGCVARHRLWEFDEKYEQHADESFVLTANCANCQKNEELDVQMG
jgi:hypothetical protein